MNYFRDIHIQNFRGYEEIELHSLERVNFFLGENNVGKTTLLESFFLLLGMTNPAIAWRINALRSSNNNNFGDLRFIFHNVDKNVPPVLSATFNDGEERSILLSTSSSITDAEIKDLKSIDSSNQWNQLVATIERRNVKGKPDFSGKTVLSVNSEGKIDGKGVDEYIEIQNALFIATADSSVAGTFSDAIKKRKKDYIIEQARLFDPRINSIELLSDGLYIGFDNVEQLLPLSMNGIGLSKFLSIVCAAACGSFHILLIDEIEDGLHYTAYQTLLKALYQFAEQNDMQFFITTHSLDTLQHLSKLVENTPEYSAMTCVYSLSRTKKGIKNYRYEGSDFVNAINNQIELRK